MPQVAALVARHPRLDVELKLDDHLIDMIHERIDVAVRIGQPRDSAAIMHKLATNRRILVAAPSYLDQRGRPRTIADLASHVCLRYDDGTTPWRLEGPSAAVAEVEMRSRLRANSGDAVHDWALAGHGVMLKSRVDVAADLAAGRLERVLDGWQGPSAPIYALMSSAAPSRPRCVSSSTRCRPISRTCALPPTSPGCGAIWKQRSSRGALGHLAPRGGPRARPAVRARGHHPRLWLVGAACTVVPDLDAIGFFLGVRYASLLGHRGLSHSLLFALTSLFCSRPSAAGSARGPRSSPS